MHYFEKYLQKHSFRPLIEQHPNSDLNICVVIPCFNEPDIILPLESLYNCTRPKRPAEVIIVINAPENSNEKIIRQNEETLSAAKNWTGKHCDARLKYHIIVNNRLPAKHAGVGLARKIGMDEAVYRLHLVNNPKGIITGFDADSVCDANYFNAIEDHFQSHPNTSGASIHFEHPVDEAPDQKLLEGIVQYELHLRYLVQAMRYCGHPHAYHTIGSSFAVKADEYVKQGGMNKRKAGEDFYFLQKIIALGNFSEINTTKVLPSPRISDRVPFGTGASMKKYMESDGYAFKTYNPEAFANLKQFFSLVEFYYISDPHAIAAKTVTLAPSLRTYLNDINYLQEIISIKENTSGITPFRNRFFRWFNAFRVVKYLNFASINGIEDEEASYAALHLLKENGLNNNLTTPMEVLSFFRKLDREGFGINYPQQ
jgi:glycosyltransferase involved in cell wall biosynthesis